MRRLRICFMALSLIWLPQALAYRAHAQGAPSQSFVPGELIVGYNSPKDRAAAMREMRTTTDKVRVRGETPRGVQARELGGSAITLHIDFPARVSRSTQGDPASELSLLQEVAQQLKEKDPRVKYAHPNWIMGIDPPMPSDGNNAPVQLQNLDIGVEGEAAPSGIVPNDPFFVLQWDYQAPPTGMNAVGAWGLSKGSKDIVVAVLDTGILSDHPDMKQSGNLLRGYNFVSRNLCTGTALQRGPDATDPGDACKGRPDSWHGTHVAGTVGAAGSNNRVGIAGVAWNVTVVPVRVLGPGGGSTSDIIDAMRWAAGIRVAGAPLNDHPADIINMSLGGPIRGPQGLFECTPQYFGSLIDAIAEVRKKGVTVVASAGNGEYVDANNQRCTPDPQHPQCRQIQDDVRNAQPAGCPGVISVAASDPNGHLAYYSNYGAVSIMAPGGDVTQLGNYVVGGKNIQLPLGVWSTFDMSKGGTYYPYQGTSQAAPHVAGAIALALARHPEWRHKPDLIEQKLRATAVPARQGACPREKPCGPGQLDAAKLLEAR